MLLLDTVQERGESLAAVWQEVSIGKQPHAVNIWRRKMQLLVFVHTDQSSVNTHTWTRGRLCQLPAQPTWEKGFANFFWAKALVFAVAVPVTNTHSLTTSLTKLLLLQTDQ